MITRNFRYCTREIIEGAATAGKVRGFPRKEAVEEKTVEEKAQIRKGKQRRCVRVGKEVGGRRKKGGVGMESGALSETAGACAWGRRGGGERNAESG